MGFGSYDESEQKDNDVDADDSEGVAVHENDHDGSVSFETEATTSDLVDKLGDMKDEDDEA
ncbi:MULTISPECIES: DUF5786 family protein [Haloarcula]|uniref:DUF5786 family protein n=4 Tax=Haloarcula TaxID=2237 RepID=A0A830FVM1_HALAR|nr:MULTISPECIES: DUF5786 family protein [Haloarcula]EMA18706.1 hypothetical protein C443_19459 [Haloarcula argentinensis DSM 12282]EMA32975.1 hypothetical protein C444_07121 [Haloarcula japonica DSM 6131]MDS0253733.1 DUF5786 family protein [Haloarcula argentinensis]NLV12233.1 death domain-associated protein [Haloarcula argentinensis]GGK76380.1 hypothetical protein GCM10009067_31050 [Haloarcula sebkhae]